jgi:hypothetical protein
MKAVNAIDPRLLGCDLEPEPPAAEILRNRIAATVER